jgi:hypothetical protein
MATPILVLGVEDIKRQNDLKVKIVEKERLAENTRANEGLQEETKSAINSALTNYARDHIKMIVQGFFCKSTQVLARKLMPQLIS